MCVYVSVYALCLWLFWFYLHIPSEKFTKIRPNFFFSYLLKDKQTPKHNLLNVLFTKFLQRHTVVTLELLKWKCDRTQLIRRPRTPNHHTESPGNSAVAAATVHLVSVTVIACTRCLRPRRLFRDISIGAAAGCYTVDNIHRPCVSIARSLWFIRRVVVITQPTSD